MSTLRNKQTKVEELSKVLEDLHSEQVAISNRIKEVAEELKALSLHSKEVEPRRIKEHKVTLEDCRYLTRRKVRILNPKRGEGNIGEIQKTGTLYVIIELEDGTVKRRIASNLRLLEHV